MARKPSLVDTVRVESSADQKRGLAPEVSAALASRAYLMVFQGDSTRMVPLPPRGPVTIGRNETCDLKLDEERVSRNHAQLLLGPNGASLEDLGSQNGTTINEVRVKGTVPLVPGDVIGVGAATIVFHASARPSGPHVLLDAEAFLERVSQEVERASRFSRPLALIVLQLTPSATPPKLDDALRRFDVAGAVTADQLAVLCLEADDEEAQARSERLLELLHERDPKIGVALFPDDGADAATLMSAARAAATNAKPGHAGLASLAYRSLVFGPHRVLVADESMQRLYELVRRLARSELSVLVQGETGTGKELVASAMHYDSGRAKKRLLAVNCAALNESLLESELFGHEKGSFTGAVATKIGLFENVAGGTIFLDEVNEMSPSLQAKLLRVLETRKVMRLGSTTERQVNFRVVAATHRDLAAEVQALRFRDDLYFRLAGATVWIPPLRDRKRELPLLARRFLEEACERAHTATLKLAPETLQLLTEHLWPGNVRELRNVMDFAAATVTAGTVEPWHLRGKVGAVSPPPPESALSPNGKVQFRPIADEVRELEQQRMLQALEATGWNQTRAAAALSMPLRTFVTRFKLYGLSRHAR